MKPLSLLVLSCLPLAAAPDQASLADALSSARESWAVTITDPIEFRIEPFAPCNLTGHGISQIAETETLDSQTTMRFDDGPAIISHQFRFVIKVNSNCDWSKLSLQNTVAHEYGHILIGDGWHSRDKRSVMYPIVNAAQKITAEDRRMVDRMARLQGYGE